MKAFARRLSSFADKLRLLLGQGFRVSFETDGKLHPVPVYTLDLKILKDMSKPSESRFNVSADDIRSYQWQRILESCEIKECHYFYEALVAESRRHDEKGDDLGGRVYALLYVVASFHPHYELKTNPYGSMWSGFNGKRSLNTEDLTDMDLKALEGTLIEIEDPEFRARVADVLWVTKRDHKAAQIAIDAFLESAARLKTGDAWPPYVERLDRAARIAAHRGFEVFEEKVVAVVEESICEFEGNLESGILCLRLMSILLALDAGDKARYSALAERLAKDFADAGNWNFSEGYWELAEQWYRLDQNHVEANRCKLAAAECNVSRAEAGLPNVESDFGYRAHWLGRGLEALRRADASPERIDEVHKKFLAMEKKSLSEMRIIKLDPESIPGLAEAERNAQEQSASAVRGQPLFQAIIRIANITKPVLVAELEEQYENASRESIWEKIIGATAVDHLGKVTDVIDPVGTGSEQEESSNHRKRLTHYARTINWPTKVAWFIEPARVALMEEHSVLCRDLHIIVLNNPFIPPGHEGFFVRGLQAGFYGDWLQSTHLLIPQIENSIRYVLNQNGVITTTLRNGIQKEKDLNDLLPSDEVKDIFGEDLTFNLRGILTERFGHNLRNESAHGLMPEVAFYDAKSVYLWWLILRICWEGFVIAHSKQE